MKLFNTRSSDIIKQVLKDAFVDIKATWPAEDREFYSEKIQDVCQPLWDEGEIEAYHILYAGAFALRVRFIIPHGDWKSVKFVI